MILLPSTAISSLTSISVGNAGAMAGGATAAGVAKPPQVSFTQLFENVATGAINTLKSAEAGAISGVYGNASPQTVVEQVMSAERALQTTIALRDKAVGAYQDITKMTI